MIMIMIMIMMMMMMMMMTTTKTGADRFEWEHFPSEFGAMHRRGRVHGHHLVEAAPAYGHPYPVAHSHHTGTSKQRTTITATTTMEPAALFCCFQVYSRYMQKLSQDIQTSIANSTKVAEEVISSMATVRSFANEPNECKRYGLL
jgi:hypothetical protein